MTMKVLYLRHFSKDLDKLDSEDLKGEVFNVIQNVKQSTSVSEIHNLKKLKGYKSAYRIKIGNYRIGIFIEKDVVEFVRIVHRKDIYKVFP